MGHLIVLILSLVLVGVLIAVFSGSKARKIKRGTLPTDAPIVRDKPSADEPSPGDSVVATPAQREAAQRHTPPA